MPFNPEKVLNLWSMSLLLLFKTATILLNSILTDQISANKVMHCTSYFFLIFSEWPKRVMLIWSKQLRTCKHSADFE